MAKSRDIVGELRSVSKAVEADGRRTRFVETEDDEVIRACACIEHGGTVEAARLATLLHYIADMME